jgi:hypothetical protein
MDYTKEQFEKLPKWAQSEITVLQNTNSSLIESVKQINGESETNVFIRRGLDNQPLPKNASIEFKTGLRNCNSVRVYVRPDGEIDINTDSRLGHEMVIRPRAANSFYITFIDRD